VGNIAILAGAAGDGGKDRYKDAVRAIMGLPEGIDFDLRDVPPAVLNMVSQYRPETYEAALPPEVALAADSMPGRDAQLYVMDELRRRSREGEPLGERIANQQAQNAIAQEMGRGQQNFMNSLEQRGRIGPGSYFQARQGFGQEAANLARDVSLGRMQQNIANRLGALKDLAGVAGAERAQTIGLEEGRSNAINRLNEYVANMLNQRNRYAADVRNEGQLRNVEERQRLADFNAVNRQNTQFQNRDTRNDRLFQQAGYGLDRGALLAAQQRALGDVEYDEQAARAQSIRGIGQGLGQAGGGLLGGLL
jgi:hypothetical protein